MKRHYKLLISIAACFLAAIAVFSLVTSGPQLPHWIPWQEAQLVCDGDGQPDEILLTDRQVRVLRDGATLWETGEDLAVQDVLWCDIDHDQQEELLLLCWRQGRYGPSRPFWVTQEEIDKDKEWSQHIFIYEWDGMEIHPSWMASDIGMEAHHWVFDPIQRLVITDTQGKATAWDWVSWGLSSIDLVPPEAVTLTFAALGDNLIHRPIYDDAFRNFGGSFHHLFADLQQELDQYDVTSLNQETIYVEDPAQYSDFPSFGTPIQVGHAVIDAGFDIISGATNHALDKGLAAIDRTVALYQEAGVVCAGLQSSQDPGYRPYELYETQGIRCAVFAYTQSTNGHPLPEAAPWAVHTLQDEAQVRADLAAGRAEADLCLVYVHWGTEYAQTPDAQQQRWAQRFADWGADVVIGTHPHVVQPWTWVTGQDGHRTLVYYSLGNFISAQTQEACRQGGLAWFQVTKAEGRCAITDCGMKPLVTQEENGRYTTHLAS